MKYLHMTNAVLWCTNAIVWLSYANSIPVAAAATAATFGSIYMWHLARYD